MNWDELKDFTETEVRGKVVTLSIDIEFSLLAIMAYSSPDPYNQQREFKKMTMGNKIDCAIADLKKHKPEYFAQYEIELAKLEEFRIVRNDMAHHRMDFPEVGNNQVFRIYYVDLFDGKEAMHYKDYTLDYIHDFVIRCYQSNHVFARLVRSLEDELPKRGT